MGDAKLETSLPPYLEGNSLVRALRETYTSFSERREALGLSNPGTVENIAREVQKDVFLTNSMFTGLRADFSRPLSVTPLFQYTHAFAMGAQGIPPYGFSAIYGTQRVGDFNCESEDTEANGLRRYSCKATSITTGN